MDLSITLVEDDVHKGSLILLNDQYPLKDIPLRIPLDLIRIDNNFIHVHHLAKSAFLSTLETIKSYDQIVPFDFEKIAFGKEDNIDVSTPARFEHKVGLAINLKLNNRTLDTNECIFPNNGVSRDFTELCVYFGLIQRFPEDKMHLTKVSLTSHHFRYVGYPHSKIMKDKCLCLEEYIDYLRLNCLDKPLFYDNYEIKYVRYEGKPLRVTVAEHEDYSGNNCDGFIFTKKV